MILKETFRYVFYYFIRMEPLKDWRKLRHSCRITGLAETPQPLAVRRLGRQSAERARISEINWILFLHKKNCRQTRFFSSWSAVWGSEWIRNLFHVISNKPMNGFSWMHGTVLLIPARLYSLHNRWWHHTGEWHRDYPARHWRIYLPRFVCFPQACCSCYLSMLTQQYYLSVVSDVPSSLFLR